MSLDTSVPNQNIIYDMVQGLIAPVIGWIVLAVVVVAVSASMWLRTTGRRRQGLAAPPIGLTAIKIALVAIVGAATLICLLSTLVPARRGASLDPVEGLRYE